MLKNYLASRLKTKGHASRGMYKFDLFSVVFNSIIFNFLLKNGINIASIIIIIYKYSEEDDTNHYKMFYYFTI